MAAKISRQIMFSRIASDYLDSILSGERSGYVNGLVEKDIEKKEKAARSKA